MVPFKQSQILDLGGGSRLQKSDTDPTSFRSFQQPLLPLETFSESLKCFLFCQTFPKGKTQVEKVKQQLQKNTSNEKKMFRFLMWGQPEGLPYVCLCSLFWYCWHVTPAVDVKIGHVSVENVGKLVPVAAIKDSSLFCFYLQHFRRLRFFRFWLKNSQEFQPFSGGIRRGGKAWKYSSPKRPQVKNKRFGSKGQQTSLPLSLCTARRGWHWCRVDKSGDKS